MVELKPFKIFRINKQVKALPKDISHKIHPANGFGQIAVVCSLWFSLLVLAEELEIDLACSPLVLHGLVQLPAGP